MGDPPSFISLEARSCDLTRRGNIQQRLTLDHQSVLMRLYRPTVRGKRMRPWPTKFLAEASRTRPTREIQAGHRSERLILQAESQSVPPPLQAPTLRETRPPDHPQPPLRMLGLHDLSLRSSPLTPT